MTAPLVQIGEGFAGDGVDAAHVNTVLGPRDGPIGGAWANALASPRAGHAPFVVVAEPNLPVQADDVVREQGDDRERPSR